MERENLEIETKRVDTPPVEGVEVKGGGFPTWFDLLAILGLFFLTQLITATIFMALGWTQLSIEDISNLSRELQRVAEQDMGRSMLLWAIVSQSMMLVSLLIYRTIRRGGWGTVRYSYRGFNPTILLWGILMLLSLVVVMEPLMALFPEPPVPVGRGTYMILAIVVVAPLFEEMICRGVILEAVRRKRGAWVACVVSSAIFGLMHVQPQLVINAFAMGLILGYIYLRTRSIFAPIILHSVNNLLAYIFIIFGISQLTLFEIVHNKNIYMLIYLCAVGVMILSMVSISKRLKILDQEEAAIEEKKREKSKNK